MLMYSKYNNTRFLCIENYKALGNFCVLRTLKSKLTPLRFMIENVICTYIDIYVFLFHY